MNPWIIITLAAAAIVFGLDYLLRRKGWKANTKTEKISLLVNMFSIGPYIFLSFWSMLWGIVPGSPESAFGELVYDATLFLGSIFFIIAAVAAIATLILRKIGKAKGSIWINVIALAYIVLVLSINTLAGKVF